MDEKEPFVNRTIGKFQGVSLELTSTEIGEGLFVHFPAVTHHPIRVVEDDGSIQLLDLLVGQGACTTTLFCLVIPDISPVVALNIVGYATKIEDLASCHSHRKPHCVLNIFADLGVVSGEAVRS